MAGLLQYYFFPTDFYYPRPQPVNSTGQKQQAQQDLAAVPASLQPQKQQDSTDIHDQDHRHQILENQEKPKKKLALRCNSNRLVLKGPGAAAASSFSTIYELRKPDKDFIRAVMLEDYGF